MNIKMNSKEFPYLKIWGLGLNYTKYFITQRIDTVHTIFFVKVSHIFHKLKSKRETIGI